MAQSSRIVATTAGTGEYVSDVLDGHYASRRASSGSVLDLVPVVAHTTTLPLDDTMADMIETSDHLLPSAIHALPVVARALFPHVEHVVCITYVRPSTCHVRNMYSTHDHRLPPLRRPPLPRLPPPRLSTALISFLLKRRIPPLNEPTPIFIPRSRFRFCDFESETSYSAFSVGW